MAKIKKVGIVSFGKFFAVVGFFLGIVLSLLYAAGSHFINKAIVQISTQITGFYIAGLFPTMPSLSITGAILIIGGSTLVGFASGTLIAFNYRLLSKLHTIDAEVE